MCLSQILGLTIIVLSGINCDNTTGKSEVSKNHLTKILGGNLVPIDDYPFLVSVQKRTLHLCGGLLVRYDWVLSAAHCTFYHTDSKDDYPLSDLTVVAGMTVTTGYRRFTPTPFGKEYPRNEPDIAGLDNLRSVVEKHLLEGFDKNNVLEDIVLFKLEYPFKESAKIRVPEVWVNKCTVEYNIVPGTWCSVAGWGLQGDDSGSKRTAKRGKRTGQPIEAESGEISKVSRAGKPRDDLVQVDVANRTQQEDSPNHRTIRQTVVKVYLAATSVQIAKMDSCKSGSGQFNVDNGSQMCTEKHDGGVCSGDSGGPLVCSGYPIGIASYGDQACAGNSAYSRTVWTRLDYIFPWINDTISSATVRSVAAAAAAVSPATVDRAYSIYIVANCFLIVFSIRLY